VILPVCKIIPKKVFSGAVVLSEPPHPILTIAMSVGGASPVMMDIANTAASICRATNQFSDAGGFAFTNVVDVNTARQLHPL
jgi:hypothetical protein